MNLMPQHTARLDHICSQAPVIPVLNLIDETQALGVCKALYDGGLRVLEVTLRNAYGLHAISAVKQALPEAIVGAGTVINVQQYQACIDAGADFIVSPGSTHNLLKFGTQASIPLLPGIGSVSEAMAGMELGYTRFKQFPAAVVGGVAMLKAIHGPLPQLKFCPTGGVKLDTASAYLQQPNVMCVGGTWLTPASLVAQEDWCGIRDLAAQATQLGA